MKLSQLVTEDVHSDKDTLSLAKKAWGELTQKIHAYLKTKNLTEFDHFEKSYDDLFGPLTLASFHVDTPDDKVVVKFERSNGLSSGTMRTRSNALSDEVLGFEIVLYQNFETDLDLISYKDFEGVLKSSFRSTFIHEYTHLLDALRSDDVTRYTKTKRKSIAKGDYHNTPQEYNAFYMQVLDDIERIFGLRQILGLYQKDPTFKTFLGLLRSESHAASVLSDELKGKYHRAYLKRLYQVYQDMKDSLF